MSALLVVDNKERHVIAELQKQKVPHVVETLDVGDYIIKSGSGIDSMPYAVWERKTYDDLAASLKDSRYADQKHRLQVHNAPVKGYIIEGYQPEGQFRGLYPGTLDSIILGLTIRDGLVVLKSNGIKHTVTILKKMLKKFPEYQEHKDGPDLKERHENTIIQGSISTVKRENYTPELCFLSQLAQIPGVSTVVARCIAEEYSSWPVLLEVVRSNDGVRKLSQLTTGKKRLGTNLAQTICKYIIPPSEPDRPTGPPPEKKRITIVKKHE